ncbi:MAG: sigma-70 family RNA polymerase sigma factor [Deltaproteobacteria bacterium]|nr:sigma-70 family RNA polymerase sigma factor [Deltaproteobacteria bacterium]
MRKVMVSSIKTDDFDQCAGLMQQAQNGNKAVYRELLQIISPYVEGMIKKRIQNHEAAEEIFQTVMLTIHRARHTYDASRPFKPWLFSVTRNTIFDYLRKHRRRFEKEILFDDPIQAKAAVNTELEEQELLQQALNVLPGDQREAVELIKLKGLSIKEAAQKVGISESAIKVRAHRGYQSLKDFLLNELKKEQA